MKLIIDIDEDYYEVVKHDVKMNHNDFKPFVLIANGTPFQEEQEENKLLSNMMEECREYAKLYSKISISLFNDMGLKGAELSLLITHYVLKERKGEFDDNIPDPPWMSCEKDCRNCKEDCKYSPDYDPDDYLKREVPSGHDTD